MSHPPLLLGTSPRILLVEDDAALRRALSFALSIEGYDVDAMGCGQALLDAAVEGAAVVVIDQVLPDLTGIECLALLRRRGATLPAILITGRPAHAPALAAQAGALGATMLQKPILGDALIAAVRRVAQPGP